MVFTNLLTDVQQTDMEIDDNTTNKNDANGGPRDAVGKGRDTEAVQHKKNSKRNTRWKIESRSFGWHTDFLSEFSGFFLEQNDSQGYMPLRVRRKITEEWTNTYNTLREQKPNRTKAFILFVGYLRNKLILRPITYVTYQLFETGINSWRKCR